MGEHVTQGRAITLGAPHACRETPRRPFSDQRNSGTRHFTVSHEPACFVSVTVLIRMIRALDLRSWIDIRLVPIIRSSCSNLG